MNLGIDFRRGLQTLPGVLEAMAARINLIWRKQHKDDGTHGAITATSITVAGNGANSLPGPTNTGPLRVESKGQSLPVFPGATDRACLEVYQLTPPSGGSFIHAKRSVPVPAPSFDTDVTDLWVRAKRAIFQRPPGSVSLNDPAGCVTATPELPSMTAGLFHGNVGVDGYLGMTGIVYAYGNIAFNPVQSPHADPHVLDDYEEGLWTPFLFFNSTAVGMTYAHQSGRYLKVGSWVWWSFYMILSSKGTSTGSAIVTGLPFPMISQNPLGAGFASYGGAMAGLTSPPSILHLPGTTDLQPVIWGPSGVTTGLTDANFTNGTSLVMHGWYQAPT